MKFLSSPRKSAIFGLLAAAALFGTASAHADSRVNWSLSVGAPLAAPVYVAPAPVYVAPAPVYVPPVVQVRSYAPAPLYVEQDVVYRDGPYWRHGREWREREWRREHHKHHGHGHDKHEGHHEHH